MPVALDTRCEKCGRRCDGSPFASLRPPSLQRFQKKSVNLRNSDSWVLAFPEPERLFSRDRTHNRPYATGCRGWAPRLEAANSRAARESKTEKIASERVLRRNPGRTSDVPIHANHKLLRTVSHCCLRKMSTNRISRTSPHMYTKSLEPTSTTLSLSSAPMGTRVRCRPSP